MSDDSRRPSISSPLPDIAGAGAAAARKIAGALTGGIFMKRSTGASGEQSSSEHVVASSSSEQAMGLLTQQQQRQQQLQPTATSTSSPTPPTITHTLSSPRASLSTASPTMVIPGVLSSNRSMVRATSTADIDNRPWTALDIGQNAIGSVLNDPTSSLSHKVDTVAKQTLTTIPKTQLRAVRMKDFEPYLNSIGEWFQRYEETRTVVVATEGGGGGAVSGGDTLAARTTTSPPLANLFTNSKPGAVRGASLDAVPKIFFEPHFNLEDSRVFDQVMEYSNVTTSTPAIGGRAAGALTTTTTTTNGVLQEKLSHYLDTVEAHLVAEISRRSSEFFSALANIQSLHDETLHCLGHIRDIRSSLAKTGDDQAKKGLEVVRRKQRRNNLALLSNTIAMVKEVKKTQPMIQVLLNQGDYVGALDLISEANRVLHADDAAIPHSPVTENAVVIPTTRKVHLTGVRGLIHLTGQLAEMSKMIGSLMESDFVGVLVGDLQRMLSQSQDAAQPSHVWASGILGANPEALAVTIKGALFSTRELAAAEEELGGRLAPLTLGLVRIERIGPALQVYNDKLMKLVKAVTKQFFPPPLPEEKDNPNAASAEGLLAKRFRALSFDEFYKTLMSVFLVLLQLQRRVALLNEIIAQQLRDAERKGVGIGTDVVRDVGPTGESVEKPPVASAGPGGTSATMDTPRYSQFIADAADILFAVSDLAHVRCGKLLTLRSDQNAQLNFKDFYRMFGVAWAFVSAGEWMCRRTCIGLRGTLMTQAKSFLNHFHTERTKDLTMRIDNDQWTQVDAAVDFQDMVDRITRTKQIAFRSGTVLADSSAFLADDLDPTSAVAAKDDEDEQRSGAALPTNSSIRPCLIVDRKRYFVVHCCLMFVKTLDEYVQCALHINSITTDVLNRLVEILKLFNTRVCGLIVGGAAVQSEVLKTITAKHLALASQCLGLVAALLPSIKAAIVEALPAKQQMLAEDLDRVMADYHSNQEQVHSRIVMIMEERVNAHCEGIATTNWDSESPLKPTTPSAEGDATEASLYMRNLVKETLKLHRILLKYVHAETVKHLFARILEMYNKKLEVPLSKLDLYTSTGKNKVLADVQYFIKVLSSLECVDGPGTRLEVVVNNIRIRDKRERVASANPERRQSIAMPHAAATMAPAPVLVAPSSTPSASGSSTTAMFSAPTTQQPSTAVATTSPAKAAANATSTAASKLGAAMMGGLGKFMGSKQSSAASVGSTTSGKKDPPPIAKMTAPSMASGGESATSLFPPSSSSVKVLPPPPPSVSPLPSSPPPKTTPAGSSLTLPPAAATPASTPSAASSVSTPAAPTIASSEQKPTTSSAPVNLLD